MAEADLIEIRRKKLEELESSGVDPYPRRFEVETSVATLRVSAVRNGRARAGAC